MSLSEIDAVKLGGIVSVRDGLIAKQAAGERVFRLESGDPSFATPAHVSAAIISALMGGKTHYTAGTGIAPLREAICDKLLMSNGIFARADEVFVTNGAMHGLYLVFQALLSRGDEVIVPNPTWTETRDNISLTEAKPVLVNLDENCRYTAENIEKAITPATAAIVINSPHNPTGMVMTREEISEVCDVADMHGLWVISDEAYEDVIYTGAHVSPGRMYDKTISIYSFSKSYAMSGLRLGYAVVKDPVLKERMAKLLRCTINGVNSATQYGGVAALTGPQDCIAEMLKEYFVRRNALWFALKESKLFTPVSPQGAFYCWCKINEWDGTDWELTEHLVDTIGVGSAPGSVFGPCEGYLRFAFSCSTDQVLLAAERLRGV
jgi:aspartate aminotransferase